MEKNPNVKDDIIREVPKHKGKRKRRKTACMDKRRGFFSCGICGSENLVHCGVIYCQQCDSEKPFVSEGGWWYPRDLLNCSCFDRSYYHSYQSVTFCEDCGAIKGPLCPNCKRPCWSKGEKRFCKHCGFGCDSWKDTVIVKS